MPTRKANAVWNGNLKSGKGTMELGSGAFEGAYSFKSRFKDGTGTNPEELIGAAHAGCYAMALSNELAEAGYEPDSVETDADVDFDMVDGNPTIKSVTLSVNAKVPEIDDDTFNELANGAKENCPVSRALSGVDIKLNTSLNS
jgi:osmotically inducible protein OsmC